MKEFFEKAVDFAKNNLISLSVILAVLAVGAVCLISLGGDEQEALQWPETEYTDGVPVFEGTPVAVTENDSSVAIYFDGIHREQADKYASELESSLKKPSGSSPKGYPKTFFLDDRSVTLHYNASELSFSVTIAKNINDQTFSSSEESK